MSIGKELAIRPCSNIESAKFAGLVHFNPFGFVNVAFFE